jgi:S-adenosylmethionine-diacylglycerol 3-amino-3-carboxypropyl transferase
MEGSNWLEAASAWPVGFAQVREDPYIDSAVADQLRPNSSLIMIASGGCSAAWLARHPKLREIVLVDANQAQLTLARLKRKLLIEYDPVTRLQVLGHASMSTEERLRQLTCLMADLGCESDCLGQLGEVAALGPDYCGRYEQLFAALQAAIRADEQLVGAINHLLLSATIEAQVAWLARHENYWQRLVVIFEEVFALKNLIALFGNNATQNEVQPFPCHFLGQLSRLVRSQPLCDNPYAWSMLCGRFPGRSRLPWLDMPPGPISTAWRYVNTTMIAALGEAEKLGEKYEMVHLSNVLDWLSEDEAVATLNVAWNCVTHGGWVVIRQLNSDLDIRALGARIGWQWEVAHSDKALLADRSFFYRGLHLGRKP